MAEFENEALGVKFTVPDTLTVRQQLAFQGGSALAEGGIFLRFWFGAIAIIEDWECEKVPDPKELDLDTETDSQIADIVRYVGNSVSQHITNLGAVPKNV